MQFQPTEHKGLHYDSTHGVWYDESRGEYLNERTGQTVKGPAPLAGGAPANDFWSDLGKGALTVLTGGLAAPLLYRNDPEPGPAPIPALDPAVTEAGDGSGTGTGLNTGSGTGVAQQPLFAPQTTPGAPWTWDGTRQLWGSVFDGGLWFDPKSNKFFSGRYQQWMPSNPAATAAFAPPAANGIGEPLPDSNAHQDYAVYLKQVARHLEKVATGPAGQDANFVLAAYLRLPTAERIRFFLMWNQSEDLEVGEAMPKVNEDTREAGVDIFDQRAFDARLRRTYGTTRGRPANDGEWYNDLLGGVHIAGRGILSAFGLNTVADALEGVEGDALPGWARKKSGGDSPKRNPPPRVAPRRSPNEAEDGKPFDEGQGVDDEPYANGASTARTGGGRGTIMGKRAR